MSETLVLGQSRRGIVIGIAEKERIQKIKNSSKLFCLVGVK